MKIKLLRNKIKPWTKEVLDEVEKFLKSKKYEIVKKDPDVTLCIGGDGTIFYFNHTNEIEGKLLAIGGKFSQAVSTKSI